MRAGQGVGQGRGALGRARAGQGRGCREACPIARCALMIMGLVGVGLGTEGACPYVDVRGQYGHMPRWPYGMA